MDGSHQTLGTARNYDSALSGVLADWYTANPRIRRACVYEMPDVDEHEESEIHVLVEIEPVMDSAEVLPVWLAHSDTWQLELQARTTRTVHLGLLSPDGAAIPTLVGSGVARRCIGVWLGRDDE